jgi:hypothetical protein
VEEIEIVADTISNVRTVRKREKRKEREEREIEKQIESGMKKV